MKKTIAIAAMLMVLTNTGIVHADVCTWAESKTWSVSAPGKLTRGVFNTALGWTNLFVQPFKGDGFMNGFGKGLSDMFVRTFQGVGEILLFWLPPVPEEPLTECVFYDWGMMERSSV